MAWPMLHVHSQYSILDSTASVDALVKKAKSHQLSALALTDKGNLYGAVEFYKACKQEGIKPILGSEMWVAPSTRHEKKRLPGQPSGFPIVLLAKNNKGYQNLCKLSSIGFLEGFYYQPRIDKEVLSLHREGLICLSGSLQGRIAYLILQDLQEELLQEIAWYRELFGKDFYFELQRHSMGEEQIVADGMDKEPWLLQKYRDYKNAQEKVNKELLSLSSSHSIACVATNEIHYLEREDWRAHEILLNIQSGEPCEIWERDSRGIPKHKTLNPKRETLASHEFYFKIPEQMKALFSDLPEALERASLIAAECHVEIDFKTKHYPVFIAPSLEGKTYSVEERLRAAEQFLYDLSQKAIELRYTPHHLAEVQKIYPNQDPLQVVRRRFEYEFELLASKGMCDYMLIVYDFIAWAKNRKIPMGPGRGSAAGSIIAYLIGITDIEPLRFHLFFERFINPERISYPDIDVDICMDRRQEVIDYTVSKYGKDRVAQIITFGTMKAKMAIKDVGRTLNVPLSKVNEIAALVPEDPTMTLEKAFEVDPALGEFMEKDEEARRILEMAQKIEGSIRNTSTHAAGLIISGGSITDYIPVCTAKDSEMVVTQFAMKPVESVGMLKIDFLGLKTLTSIQTCVDAIEKTTQKKVEWTNLPLQDRATFDLLTQGKTMGVFQLESGGMQDLVRQLHIDVFEEIIAVGALYRPGPMDMIPSFIQRKHGREEIEIDHPLMKEILSETYGVMVYQEQVMQIASVLAGYSLGEGDVLRRAMGKKDKEEMARQREKFLNGASKKGIAVEISATIFDKIEKFASYGFNKSHAAAYAYLTYTTAYLKANFPKEWMAALMTCDRDDTAKVAKFIREARSMHIEVLPPDVNQAGSEFAATADGIRFAMSGIKGVGQAVVDMILEERGAKGPFKSLYDFIERVDKTRIGKKVVEILIDAGCFDFTKWSRDSMRESVGPMFDQALAKQKETSRGVISFFSLMEEESEAESSFLSPPSVQHPTDPMQILQREKELLGFYVTGHPMDRFRSILSRLSCIPLKDIETLSDGALFRAAFVVETIAIKISTKSQKKFAILTIGDGLERFELPIWPEMFEQKGTLLRENQLLYALLQVEKKGESIHLQCRFLDDLTTLDEAKCQECNDLYDRLKASSKANESKTRNFKKTAQASSSQEKTELVRLKLNADQIRFSGILALKNLFRQHPGKSPLEIHFVGSTKHWGTIQIDSKWGIKADALFRDKIQQLSSQLGTQIEYLN